MKAVFVRLFGCSRKSNRGDQGGRGGGNDHFIIQHCPTGVPVTVPDEEEEEEEEEEEAKEEEEEEEEKEIAIISSLPMVLMEVEGMVVMEAIAV
eukprot:CAMPEP_0170867908 /NCGR_PEP_ID=MMETSP0734-20130129/23163_1 /TAXON_ID=186038 /ORGANISM="Fragilariopsis kerguelensis, Strain L26-C5" /LENGTH=93 /DNA_ID=CAMNT_0011245417 /DNA_START=179 /DNA_END=458 /DNA_ORIENTATION=-